MDKSSLEWEAAVRAAVDSSGKARWLSLFCVDPGMTTGWAWVVVELSRLAADGAVGAVKVAHGLSADLFRCGQVDCSDEDEGTFTLVEYIGKSTEIADDFCGSEVRVAVVTESFSLRERTTDSSLLSPVRIQSKLEFAVWCMNQEAELENRKLDIEWWEQSPSDAKSVCTDERMRKWDLWQTGQPHATDAIRHLVLWLRKEIGGEH